MHATQRTRATHDAPFARPSQTRARPTRTGAAASRPGAASSPGGAPCWYWCSNKPVTRSRCDLCVVTACWGRVARVEVCLQVPKKKHRCFRDRARCAVVKAPRRHAIAITACRCCERGRYRAGRLTHGGLREECASRWRLPHQSRSPRPRQRRSPSPARPCCSRSRSCSCRGGGADTSSTRRACRGCRCSATRSLSARAASPSSPPRASRCAGVCVCVRVAARALARSVNTHAHTHTTPPQVWRRVCAAPAGPDVYLRLRPRRDQRVLQGARGRRLVQVGVG